MRGISGTLRSMITHAAPRLIPLSDSSLRCPHRDLSVCEGCWTHARVPLVRVFGNVFHVSPGDRESLSGLPEIEWNSAR